LSDTGISLSLISLPFLSFGGDVNVLRILLVESKSLKLLTLVLQALTAIFQFSKTAALIGASFCLARLYLLIMFLQVFLSLKFFVPTKVLSSSISSFVSTDSIGLTNL
jgi:hypothetical protein